MRRQRKITHNIGMDTHVRDHSGNRFLQQSHSASQMLMGEVLLTQPEPLFSQNMVTVKMARGGTITSVAYPGAFIDPITGNLHGSYEGPIPGQMVMLGFENGNSNSPFVVNRYPYQGVGNTLVEEAYNTPLTKASFHASDVVTGHFSGSYLSFNTGVLPSTEIPGSVTLNAITDYNMISGGNVLFDALVSAEMKSAIVTLTGTTQVELNGNTNFAVKYTELKTAFDQLKSDLNSHVHTGVTTGGGSSGPPATPSVADMSPSKNSTVLM